MFSVVIGQPVAGPADPYQQITTMAWKAYFATAVLNTSFALNLIAAI
jgi:hypothetical protein